MNDLFSAEEQTIHEAEALLSRESTTDNPLIHDYAILLENYKKLYKQQIRLIRINDRQSSKLSAEKSVLEKHSKHDGLTGILNRRSFDENYPIEWAKSVKYGHCLSLLMIDIDHFKTFNDTYGHQVGDNILIQVALQVQSAARREGDIAARYGGEEFIIMLPAADHVVSCRIAEKLRIQIESMKHNHQGSQLGITISIGIASMNPRVRIKQENLIKQADMALYRSKKNGRNQICLFDDLEPMGENYD